MIFFFIKLYIEDVFDDEEEREEEAEEEEEETINIKKAIRYEDKYLDKLNNLKKKELSDDYLNGLKNTIVMEMTPNGNVIMYWDNSRDAFVYYSDSTIPYRFLEVVARKYAIVNDCLNIFIIRK
jgi:hypothetical protein